MSDDQKNGVPIEFSPFGTAVLKKESGFDPETANTCAECAKEELRRYGMDEAARNFDRYLFPNPKVGRCTSCGVTAGLVATKLGD